MKRLVLLTLLTLAALCASHLARADTPVNPTRPLHWAKNLDARFLLYQIAPGLYRSARPDADAVPLLQALGIVTIVNLYQQSDADWLPASANIREIHLPLSLGSIDDEDVITVLRHIRAALADGPVLVHCRHGQNRSGLIAALWRILYQGWRKQDAIAEMRSFGAGRRMENALAYFDRADLGALRTALQTGACSTRRLAWCKVAGWLARP